MLNIDNSGNEPVEVQVTIRTTSTPWTPEMMQSVLDDMGDMDRENALVELQKYNRFVCEQMERAVQEIDDQIWSSLTINHHLMTAIATEQSQKRDAP